MSGRTAARRLGARRRVDASYARSLEDYLTGGGEDALRQAYELGRGAIAGGLGLLEMVALHNAALREVADRAGSPLPPRSLDRAGEILAEFLSPCEMALRGFRNAISALRRINETLEAEIQRLAHDVHDEAGQLLVAARLALSEAGRDAAPGFRRRLGKVAGILDRAEGELRRISHELRPLVLDDLGLVPALQLLADGVSGRSRLEVAVASSLRRRPDRRIETAIYRIAQEALSNAARHARARRVWIRLSQDGAALRCLIQDDGVGFDAAAVLAHRGRRGLGLLGMRERLDAIGGTFQIRSRKGRGTELRITIPVEA
jgi:signal transduction histidine kinase